MLHDKIDSKNIRRREQSSNKEGTKRVIRTERKDRCSASRRRLRLRHLAGAEDKPVSADRVQSLWVTVDESEILAATAKNCFHMYYLSWQLLGHHHGTKASLDGIAESWLLAPDSERYTVQVVHNDILWHAFPDNARRKDVRLHILTRACKSRSSSAK